MVTPFWCLCQKLSLSPLHFNKTSLHTHTHTKRWWETKIFTLITSHKLCIQHIEYIPKERIYQNMVRPFLGAPPQPQWETMEVSMSVRCWGQSARLMRQYPKAEMRVGFVDPEWPTGPYGSPISRVRRMSLPQAGTTVPWIHQLHLTWSS